MACRHAKNAPSQAAARFARAADAADAGAALAGRLCPNVSQFCEPLGGNADARGALAGRLRPPNPPFEGFCEAAAGPGTGQPRRRARPDVLPRARALSPPPCPLPWPPPGLGVLPLHCRLCTRGEAAGNSTTAKLRGRCKSVWTCPRSADHRPSVIGRGGFGKPVRWRARRFVTPRNACADRGRAALLCACAAACASPQCPTGMPAFCVQSTSLAAEIKLQRAPPVSRSITPETLPKKRSVMLRLS
jgi:hypothetical protein